MDSVKDDIVVELPDVYPLPRCLSFQDGYDYIKKYLVAIRCYTSDEADYIINSFDLCYVDKGYYANRVVIPVYDHVGVYSCFCARYVGKRAMKQKVLNPDGAKMGCFLFNQHRCNDKIVFVVEGVFDVFRLWLYGVPAVAVFGAALSGIQAKKLIECYDHVILVFDGDRAGRRATNDVYARLMPYVNVTRLDLKYGDPDDILYGDFFELLKFYRIYI